MTPEISSEQYWKLYKTLPKPLQEALGSNETADTLKYISDKYDIGNDTQIIVDSNAAVLLGILPPNELQGALEKETEIDKEAIKKIVQEINRLIFYPVRSYLKELYDLL